MQVGADEELHIFGGVTDGCKGHRPPWRNLLDLLR